MSRRYSSILSSPNWKLIWKSFLEDPQIQRYSLLFYEPRSIESVIGKRSFETPWLKVRVFSFHCNLFCLVFYIRCFAWKLEGNESYAWQFLLPSLLFFQMTLSLHYCFIKLLFTYRLILLSFYKTYILVHFNSIILQRIGK